MTKQRTGKKFYKDPVFVTVFIIVLAIALAALTISIRYVRARHSPNDIKSFVISKYNGSELENSQVSQTLTLTPNSCNIVVQTPTQGNYATTIQCSMNAKIWNDISNAYFTNSLPTQSASKTTPTTGQIVLLGVYYNDGTSNTVYFTNPLPANSTSFLQTIKSNQPALDGF